MKEKQNLISLDEVFIKAHNIKKEFINKLEREEKLEPIETEDMIKNEIIGNKKQTDRVKKKFIEDIKSGLGDVIKAKPKPVIIEKKWYENLSILIKKIFTKF